MKILAEFKGKVLKLNPAPERSVVRLQEKSNNAVIETGAITEELIKHGIGEGDEFQILIQEDDTGKSKGVMTKIVAQ